MISYPIAKINLGLWILRKREDGFHEIESVMYPVPWKDILEIIPSPDKKFSYSQSGFVVDGDTESNLVVKAYRLLEKAYKLPAVKIHLHKQIPMGAGLGGGSADAAFTLLMLNDLFDLKLSVDQLKNYASVLGSDCAFFIESKPALASGRGEKLESIELDLSGKYLLIHKPHIHVSTAEAYANCNPQERKDSLSKLVDSDIDQWKNLLANDFEESLFPSNAQIALIKEKMYNSGAVYAAMSGSGSSVFGIFDNKPVPPSEWDEKMTLCCQL